MRRKYIWDLGKLEEERLLIESIKRDLEDPSQPESSENSPNLAGGTEGAMTPLC